VYVLNKDTLVIVQSPKDNVLYVKERAINRELVSIWDKDVIIMVKKDIQKSVLTRTLGKRRI
jgi:hypothetical protein